MKHQLCNSLRWPIYIFNLVEVTKLPCYLHRGSTTVSLETFILYTKVLILSLMYRLLFVQCGIENSILQRMSEPINTFAIQKFCIFLKFSIKYYTQKPQMYPITKHKLFKCLVSTCNRALAAQRATKD